MIYSILHPCAAALGKSNRSKVSRYPVGDVFHSGHSVPRYPRGEAAHDHDARRRTFESVTCHPMHGYKLIIRLELYLTKPKPRREMWSLFRFFQTKRLKTSDETDLTIYEPVKKKEKKG